MSAEMNGAGDDARARLDGRTPVSAFLLL